MKKRFFTVSLAVLLTAQSIFLSGCEKSDPENRQQPTTGQAAVDDGQKIIGAVIAVAATVYVIHKIHKNHSRPDMGGGIDVPLFNNEPVDAMSMIDAKSLECITSDNSYATIPFDLVADCYLLKTNLGIAYAIDSVDAPAAANWVFSSDTLTFSEPVVINHPATLQTLDVREDITIYGSYPVYSDGHYRFILIR